MYCIVLHCIVLYCWVLYSTVLHSIVVLYCIILYYIAMYCIVLHFIVLYCIVSEFHCSRLIGILRVGGGWVGVRTHWETLHLKCNILCNYCFKNPAMRNITQLQLCIKLENNKPGIDNAGLNTVNEIYTDDVSFNE